MAGFWAGFGDTLSKKIDDRQSFIREETSRRQEYLRNVGIPAINKRNQEVDTHVNSILQAESLGLDRAVATSLWEAGTLDVALKQITDATDPKSASTYYNTIANLTDEQVKRAQDPAAVVRKAYGIAAKADVSTEEGRQAGLFETMFALNPQAAADRSMAGFGVAGYTEADAAAAMAGSSRIISAPPGTPNALMKSPRKDETTTEVAAINREMTTTIGSLAGAQVENTGTDVYVTGDSARDVTISSSKATSAYVNMSRNNVSNAVARAKIVELSSKLLNKPVQVGGKANFTQYNEYLDMIAQSDDPEATIDAILDEVDSAAEEATTTPPPATTPPPSSSPLTGDASTWGDGILDGTAP